MIFSESFEERVRPCDGQRAEIAVVVFPNAGHAQGTDFVCPGEESGKHTEIRSGVSRACLQQCLERRREPDSERNAKGKRSSQ